MDHYAVFGNPVMHSKSPFIHGLFAQQTEQHLDYRAQHIELDDFAHSVAEFFALGDNRGSGLNVTLPFKGDAWQCVDDCSLAASRARAVNTIKRLDNGDLYGANTDGIGLCNDLEKNLNWSLHNQRILLVGAGGAARGVVMPLLNCQPELLTITNRTIEKAHNLAKDFSDTGAVAAMGERQLKRESFDLVINASSSSIDAQLPNLPASIWTAQSKAYDMFYSRGETAFVQWAKLNKVVHAADGLGMLVEQAAESFELWRGVRPDTAKVIAKVRADINNSEP